MRMMLKFTIPVERGNQAEKDGTLGRTISNLVESVNAEAAYFALEDGKRMGIVIFEESDQAKMPVLNEPLFAALNASIQIQPVMTVEDLQRAL
ncbi:MAG: hypothetical protein AAGD47_12685 [Pseudomonadota bacterium]